MIRSKLVGHAASEFRVSLRSRNILPDWTRRADREDDGLRVFFFTICRYEKGSVLASPDRPGETALENSALLGRAQNGKGFACVQMVIAEQKIEGTVVFLRARLGDNLDAPASRSRILRGIRILINLHLLNGRRRHS